MPYPLGHGAIASWTQAKDTGRSRMLKSLQQIWYSGQYFRSFAAMRIFASLFLSHPGSAMKTPSMRNVSCGVRTHAQLPAMDLKSTPLTTRAN